MSEFKRCPECGALSDIDAHVCDCGHRFQTVFPVTEQEARILEAKPQSDSAVDDWSSPPPKANATTAAIWFVIVCIVFIAIAGPLADSCENSSQRIPEINVKWIQNNGYLEGDITNTGGTPIYGLHTAIGSEALGTPSGFDIQQYQGTPRGEFYAVGNIANSFSSFNLDSGASCIVIFRNPALTKYPPDVAFRDSDGNMIPHRDLDRNLSIVH